MFLNKRTKQKMHPQKMAMYIGIFSILMLFAAFTSAFLVRRAAGGWISIQWPPVFWISTCAILLSSASLLLCHYFYKKEKYTWLRLFSFITFSLGILFVFYQYQGYIIMQQNGILLNSNPSASFLYVIAGIHVLHIIGGLFFLLRLFIKSLFTLKTDTQKINYGLSLELTSIYWHFVDLLWIYLFVFMFIYN